ncbi:tail fiber assembly protein [Xenorhabdus sp. TH1]|uniref:tail fiber assembly protein n=1 Tax=Xenorhabdus sp. TH1 TaxID=3130166 RepID=UPI0030D4E125
MELPWRYIDGKIEKIPTDYISIAKRQKSRLMEIANSTVAPLQDVVDLNMATTAETSALTAWHKYRMLLNQVDCATAPDIQWPEQPK